MYECTKHWKNKKAELDVMKDVLLHDEPTAHLPF